MLYDSIYCGWTQADIPYLVFVSWPVVCPHMPAETALVDDTNVTDNTDTKPEASSEVNGDHVIADDGVDREDLDLGYQVSLDSFSGPLDLLLYLVRRSEVDITDIPIAQIADQFLATLQSWDDMDLDIAGDFILMAASLLEIKARLIVPSDEEQQEEEEDFIDPREELIQQLLQFRKFKEATQLLQSMEDNNLLVHHRRYSEQIPEDEDQADYNLENADAYQLFVLWDQTLVSIAGKRPRTVVYDDIPIEQRVKQVLATMETALEGQLNWLFASVETRIQRIGVFVAVLECVRKKYLEVIQHEQYGSVYMRYKEEEERASQPVLPPDLSEDEDGKKKRRRRKRQLVTYRAPEMTEEEMAAAEAEEAEQSELEFAEDDEIQVETDEQRFLRELNEETSVDNLLAVGKDLDAAVQAHLYDQGVLEDVAEEAAALDAEEFDDDDDEFDDDDDDDGVSLIDLVDDEEDDLAESEDEEDYEEDSDEVEVSDEEDDELVEDEEEYDDDDEDEEDEETLEDSEEDEDDYLEDDEEDEYDDEEDEYDDDDEFDDEEDE